MQRVPASGGIPRPPSRGSPGDAEPSKSTFSAGRKIRSLLRQRQRGEQCFAPRPEAVGGGGDLRARSGHEEGAVRARGPERGLFRPAALSRVRASEERHDPGVRSEVASPLGRGGADRRKGGIQRVPRHRGVHVRRNGSFVYQSETAPGLSQLAWFDMDGKRLSTAGDPAAISGFAVSPDGKRSAAVIDGPDGPRSG